MEFIEPQNADFNTRVFIYLTASYSETRETREEEVRRQLLLSTQPTL